MAENDPKLKTKQSILTDMIASVSANSPVTDLNPGSVLGTILSASASEDFEQYYEIGRLFQYLNIDNLTGQDLDDYAFGYGVERREALPASGKIIISRPKPEYSANVQLTGIPPKIGDEHILVEINTNFEKIDALTIKFGGVLTGDLVIGTETVKFSKIVEDSVYYKFELLASLTQNHDLGDTLYLKLGESIQILDGTKITIPGSQREASKVFTVSGDHTLESARTSVGGILVVADVPGASGNIQEGVINSIDFFDKTSLDITANPNLTVVNPNSFTNGLDRETDSELIDKIKLVTQGLTGGTSEAIRSALLNLVEPETNRSIYSVGLESFEDVNNIYIDGGLGIDQEFQYQNIETILEAKGGETLLQLENRPVAYPFIETKEINVVGKTLGDFIEGKSFNFQVYNPNLASDSSNNKGRILRDNRYTGPDG